MRISDWSSDVCSSDLLLANIDAARRLVEDWGWETLGALREPAMRQGLDDVRVRALCADVLAVAGQGLAISDRRWLAYCAFVLASGRSGADRLTVGRASGRAGGVQYVLISGGAG